MKPSSNTSSQPLFVHRENRNGTIDSICLWCYATVSTARCESDLDVAERGHRCDPVELKHFEEFRQSGSSDWC